MYIYDISLSSSCNKFFGIDFNEKQNKHFMFNFLKMCHYELMCENMAFPDKSQITILSLSK